MGVGEPSLADGKKWASGMSVEDPSPSPGGHQESGMGVGDPNSDPGEYRESGIKVGDPSPAAGAPSESLQEDLDNGSENGEQGMRRTRNSARLGAQKWRKMDP